MTEWIVLERTFRGHIVQAPCNEQGHLRPDQIVQSPVQPDLGCFQRWGICHFTGQPVPVSHVLNIKNSFQVSCLRLFSFRSKPLLPCPVATGPIIFALTYLYMNTHTDDFKFEQPFIF